MKLEKLRKEVCGWHAALPENHLVTWTSGNISARDPKTGLIVIKPSGVKYEGLTPKKMVIVDENGEAVKGKLKPSSDTASHCVLYRAWPAIHAVVHTHSPYATAWAAVGRSIPAVLTAIADEFGGPVPCGGFALIGGEQIGDEVVRSAREGCPAVLLQNHGVFTFAETVEAAVKAAVMVEDVARTVWFAEQLGEPVPIPDDVLASLRARYRNEYGQ